MQNDGWRIEIFKYIKMLGYLLMNIHQVLSYQFSPSQSHRDKARRFIYDILTEITAPEGLSYNLALFFYRNPLSPWGVNYFSGKGAVNLEHWNGIVKATEGAHLEEHFAAAEHEEEFNGMLNEKLKGADRTDILHIMVSDSKKLRTLTSIPYDGLTVPEDYLLLPDDAAYTAITDRGVHLEGKVAAVPIKNQEDYTVAFVFVANPYTPEAVEKNLTLLIELIKKAENARYHIDDDHLEIIEEIFTPIKTS